jgi:hypothetical protein
MCRQALWLLLIYLRRLLSRRGITLSTDRGFSSRWRCNWLSRLAGRRRRVWHRIAGWDSTLGGKRLGRWNSGLLVAERSVRLREWGETSIDVDTGFDVQRSPLTRVVAVGSGRRRSRIERQRSVATGIETGIVELGPAGLLRSSDALKLLIGLLRNRNGRRGGRKGQDAAGQERLGTTGDDRLRGQGAIQPLLTADRTARMEPKPTMVTGLDKVCG